VRLLFIYRHNIISRRYFLDNDSSSLGSDDTYDSEYIDFDTTNYVTSSGTYYVLFYVDYHKEVIEINENNNSGKIAFTVNL
jgi:subtilase family serine protease